MKDAQKPDHVSLNTLLGRIKEGRFVIPDFQREFEWSPWDIRDLMRSIFLDYYIGSLLLWKGTKENIDALSCEPIYGYEGKGNPESIVLDGQQRLTALYYVFTAPDVPLPNRTSRAIYFIRVDEFMREEYDKAFYYEWITRRWSKILKDVSYQYEYHIFPLSVVGAGGWELGNWVQGYAAYWKEKAHELRKTDNLEAYEKAQRHAENAKEFGTVLKEITEQYQIAYIELDRELSVDKICDIFTQINSRGVRLDAFDLINALLKPKGLQLKKLWREAAPKLEFVDTPKMNVYILQVMSIIRQAYCSPKYLYFLLPGQEKPIREPDGTRRKEILVKDIKDFEKRWMNAVNALDEAIKLLQHPQEFGAIKSNYLPYVSILPIFAALQAQAKILPPAKQLGAQRKIRYWYWASVFTNRYSGSVESTSARDFLDIKAWMEADDSSPAPALIDEFKTRFRSLDLRSETKRGTSIYSSIFNLFILNGARDWITGNVAKNEDLDDHHIVPSSWGYDNSLGDSINTILNRSPLTTETNRHIIGDDLPNEYLPKLIESSGEDKVRAMLNAHFISTAAMEILLRNPFTGNDFQEFIAERQRTIFDAIENLLIKERIDLEPSLRQLDEKVEKIELLLRAIIERTLQNDANQIPQHISQKVEERILQAVRKNPALDASSFQSLHSKLEYFDLRELEGLIVNSSLWSEFEEFFVSKTTLNAKFNQLAELRNSIRHSRSVNDVTKKEGEAAIIWFNDLLHKHNIAPPPEQPETSMDDENNGTSSRDIRKYDATAYGATVSRQAKRNAIFHVVKSLCDRGAKPENIAELIHWRSRSVFFEVEGECSSEEFIRNAKEKLLRINGKVFDPGRWYCEDDELIIQDGKTFAFSNQWGFRWMEAVNLLSKEFPEANIECQPSQSNI